MKHRLQQYTRRTGASLGRIIRDESGSLLPMVAGSMLMLTGAAGMAIDGARMFYVKDVLQKSLDSAGLAAGHAMTVSDMENDAREFFNANVGSIDGVVTTSNMTVDISPDNELITLTASATVEATFMRLFGYESITVSASTEVSRETRGMELVLVMDNTGSMRTDNKIGTMKQAATDLINVVFGDDETNTNLWAGVVPYITHVNVGNTNYNWLSETGKDRVDNEYYGTEWKAACAPAPTAKTKPTRRRARFRSNLSIGPIPTPTGSTTRNVAGIRSTGTTTGSMTTRAPSPSVK